MNTWCHSISVTFKFWCWVPRESVLRGSSVHKATHTAQNLKVTLIEWLLKLTLLVLHQVFRPLCNDKSKTCTALLLYFIWWSYMDFLESWPSFVRSTSWQSGKKHLRLEAHKYPGGISVTREIIYCCNLCTRLVFALSHFFSIWNCL